MDIVACYRGWDTEQPSELARFHVSKTKPAPPVEDRLLRMQQHYSAKIATKREESASISREMTFTPRLDERSRQIAVAHRFNVNTTRPSTRAESQRAVERNQSPTINARSAQMQRGTKELFAWQAARVRHQFERKQGQEVEAVGTFTPQIDAASRFIAVRRRDPKPVEETLLEYGERKKEELDRRREEVSSVHGHRSIDTNGIEVQERAGHRLHHDAEERQRAAEEALRKVELGRVVDETGEIMFHPRINENSTNAQHKIPHENVFDYLSRPREAYNEQTDDTIPIPPSPKIGVYSELLAKLHRISRDDPKDLAERLARPKQMTTTTSPGPSFKPKIDEHSRKLDAKKSPKSGSRTERLFEKQAQYEAHRVRLQQEEQERIAECERKEATEMVKTAPVATPRALFERQDAWRQKLTAKLKAKQKEKAAAELEECTFRPQLQRYIPER